MTTKASLPPSEIPDIDDDDTEEASPACVLVFNASDPSGAGGLTADITTIASVGGHPIAVVTGAYARDTAQIFDHFSFDDEAVSEQARAVLEDLPVLENLDLRAVSDGRYTLYAAPLKISGAEGAPCRALLVAAEE